MTDDNLDSLKLRQWLSYLKECQELMDFQITADVLLGFALGQDYCATPQVKVSKKKIWTPEEYAKEALRTSGSFP